MSLMIVGSVALDDIETGLGKVEGVLGGAASYASVAASYFVRPDLVAAVGSDFPGEHIDFFKQRGVNTKALETLEGKTFRWAGCYHEDFVHRDTLLTELGVFENWLPTIPAGLKSSPYVFLGNIHPDLQLHVLNQLENPRLVACDTMDLWINVAKEDLIKVLGKTNIVLMNDEEARLLTGQVSLSQAAKDIQSMGPGTVIIKRGEHGASVHSGGKLFYIPSYPIDRVVDPTGAGDTFAGSLMGYLAKQDSISFEEICRGVIHGSVLASFIVEDHSMKRLINSSKEEGTLRRRVLDNMVRV